MRTTEPHEDETLAAPLATADASFTPPPQRTRIFTLICLGVLCGQMGYSIITPFFPKESGQKGAGAATVGWIFGVFEASVLATTPLAVRLLGICGAKPLLIAGNGFGGLGNIALAFAWYTTSEAAFVAVCVALRVLAGAAYATHVTIAYSLLPHLFGPNISTATGTLDSIVGLAMIVAPALGGALFELGGGAEHLGFVLPFVTLGALELLFSLTNFVLLPWLPVPPRSDSSLTRFSKKVLVPVAVCVVTGASLGMLEPTLQPHFGQAPLHLSIPYVGWLLSACCLCYALPSPAVGALDDATGGRCAVVIMALGLLLTGLGFGLLGPLPGLTPSRLLCWAGMLILGAGCSLSFTPVFRCTLQFARHTGDEERTVATSALFTMSFSVGCFLGPTVGGMLGQIVGDRTTYIAACVALWALALLLFALAPLYCTASTE